MERVGNKDGNNRSSKFGASLQKMQYIFFHIYQLTSSRLQLPPSLYIILFFPSTCHRVHPLPMAEVIVASFHKALSPRRSMMSEALGGLLIKLPISLFASAQEVQANAEIETRKNAD